MIFRARQFEFVFLRPALVMGVVNVTPDSFSDGGKFLDANDAVAHALKLVAQGADILDIGGESTRPGAQPVSEADELQRVIPVIEKLAGQIKIPISIDTTKPAVARAALQAGASIVNDVSANRENDELWKVVSDFHAGYICMHASGKDFAGENILGEVSEFFQEQLGNLLNRIGVIPEQVVLDVGIGFGKTPEQNLQLIANVKAFAKLRRPLLLGVSRKSFIGKLLGAEVNERLPASLACAILAVESGVQIIRTHDVAETIQAVRLTEALLAPKENLMPDQFHILNLWRPALEILVLAVAIYYTSRFLRGTRGWPVVIGFVIVLLALALITTVLDLPVLRLLLGAFSTFFVFAVLIIFQPELRRLLAELGNLPLFATTSEQRESIEVVIQTCERLADVKIGALIAIEQSIQLQEAVESSLSVDCDATPEMLETIFFPNNAIHDGGVILKGDRIAYAACIFPLTQRSDLNKSLGTRHRAAIGLSEETDAVIVVVSEETGMISYAYKGQLTRGVTLEELRAFLISVVLRPAKTHGFAKWLRAQFSERHNPRAAVVIKHEPRPAAKNPEKPK